MVSGWMIVGRAERGDGLHTGAGDVEVDDVGGPAGRGGIAPHAVERHVAVDVCLVVDRRDSRESVAESLIGRNRVAGAGHRDDRRRQPAFQLLPKNNRRPRGRRENPTGAVSTAWGT